MWLGDLDPSLRRALRTGHARLLAGPSSARSWWPANLALGKGIITAGNFGCQFSEFGLVRLRRARHDFRQLLVAKLVEQHSLDVLIEQGLRPGEVISGPAAVLPTVTDVLVPSGPSRRRRCARLASAWATSGCRDGYPAWRSISRLISSSKIGVRRNAINACTIASNAQAIAG